jgi:hypothetical protein
VIEHEGRTYKKVMIEDHNEEFWMDEEQNIYDLNLKLVGQAGGSDNSA